MCFPFESFVTYSVHEYFIAKAYNHCLHAEDKIVDVKESRNAIATDYCICINEYLTYVGSGGNN